MAKSFLLPPEQLRERLSLRYRNKRRDWLAGGDTWPLRLPLGVPTEQEASCDISQVRVWRDCWSAWAGPGTVCWTERRWPALGTQSLPHYLELATPAAVADLVGQHAQWLRAEQRFAMLSQRWPVLVGELPGHFDILAEWDDVEFERFVAVLGCLSDRNWQGYYVRQLPVPGVDSKWLERRRAVLASWLGRILGIPSSCGLYAMTGLLQPPKALHLRLLDPQLRASYGGLSNIQTPVEGIAAARPNARRVFIVENLQTGLAFNDIPGAILFMKQGYAVDEFGRIPWLKDLPCHYWGDIDTHGFAILNRLRQHLPQVESLLMDRETLLAHKTYWGAESTPASHDLTRLSDDENALYKALKDGRYGTNIRLEQEHIAWNLAWSTISQAVTSMPAD